MIDPSKDKFAYFKDNIQTAEDKEDFDASQYYYHRDDFLSTKNLNATTAFGTTASPHLTLSAFHSMATGLGAALVETETGKLRCLSLPQGLMDQYATLAPMHSPYSSYSSGLMQGGGGPSPFVGSTSIGRLQGGAGAMSSSHELHRGNAGRTFQVPTDPKAPDLSEFPALSSRLGSLSLDTGLEGSVADRMRAQPSEFVIQKEDFPALSTFGSSSTSDKSPSRASTELKRHASFTASLADGLLSSQLEPPTSGTSLIGSRVGASGSSSMGKESTSGSGTYGAKAFDPFRAPRSSEHAPLEGETNKSKLDSSHEYGLLGMLHSIIRSGADARTNVAMGCDLTSLGLNLNAAEPLHPTFASPWAHEPNRTKEPPFTLPSCYYNHTPVLKTTHLSKFHLETLFYIFYAMPKDVLQAYAAQELYTREWRYHGDLKTWLKRASAAETALLPPPASGAGGADASGGAPASGGSMGAIGSAPGSPQFVYFDTTTWERRVLTGNVSAISAGLLSDEDIRVKFNASSS
ncbi:hypothetical protein PsorP6_016149 [Peronosclerospora sorghi]|uniref:Uncharacterized protein n=1 Tax=Peronosclerospora sorghi TaxID=230839 RepID=A0ACC0VQG2_9STRA|nr:hypothetical protein PsorP6_016149 [Peronosclerospora sorghi]